ncbi:MAG TPA: helix-turn-helix transcriptional regulator [Candidatus Dietzia merdigallinarum]|nr:helix-turn-helix transcriptional regulator [Candidatus Dietzia merdigallinarum]
MGREYDQFCGLARAAEVLGERWTLLILRDLSVGPARFTDLKSGLPGIAATMLTARLRGLEEAGVVERSQEGKVGTYTLTARGRAAFPALRELSLWGASTMAEPRPAEVVTDRSLAAMLATTRTSARVEPFVVEIRAAGAAAHATVSADGADAAPGSADAPSLILSGPGLRAALAEPSATRRLVSEGHIEVEGSPELLVSFAAAFHAPLE